MENYLAITKYEKVRVIGLRATQLSLGAKPLTDITGLINPLDIAEKEFNEGTIPISIIRTLPNKQKMQINIVAKRKEITRIDSDYHSDSSSDSDSPVLPPPRKNIKKVVKSHTDSDSDSESDSNFPKLPVDKKQKKKYISDSDSD